MRNWEMRYLQNTMRITLLRQNAKTVSHTSYQCTTLKQLVLFILVNLSFTVAEGVEETNTIVAVIVACYVVKDAKKQSI